MAALALLPLLARTACPLAARIAVSAWVRRIGSRQGQRDRRWVCEASKVYRRNQAITGIIKKKR